LTTISIGGLLCFFVNVENRKGLNYLIPVISASSGLIMNLAEYVAEGARAIGTDVLTLFVGNH
jgi:hypothetical protein